MCRATQAPQNTKTVFWFGLYFLIIALWITTRSYTGIHDDAVLYAGQAINDAFPGRLSDDLFFRFGSQDQYTIFSKLYAPAVVALGLARAYFLLTIVGQASWLASLLFFVRSMYRKESHIVVGIATVLALPGSVLFFGYGESIMTPRIYAQAICLVAIGAMVKNRSLCSLFLFLIALSVHPLITIPGFLFFFCYKIHQDPRWLAGLLSAATLCLILAVYRIPPFSHLLLTFDPSWLRIVRLRDAGCFLTRWMLLDYLRTTNIVLISLMAWAVAGRDERVLLGCALTVALVCLATALLFGDILNNVLVVQIQLWRVFWLLSVIGNMSIGIWVTTCLKRGFFHLTSGQITLLFGLVIDIMSSFDPSLCLIALPTIAVGMIYTILSDRNLISKSMQLMSHVFLISYLLLVCYFAFLSEQVQVRVFTASLTEVNFLKIEADQVLCILLVSVIFMIVMMSEKFKIEKSSSIIFLFISLISIVDALVLWDQRSPWSRYVDASSAAPASFSALFPGDSAIYWEGDIAMPWFRLARQSYFSCQQGGGVIFNRDSALLYQSRFEMFQKFSTIDFSVNSVCPPLDSGDKPSQKIMPGSEFRSFCKNNPSLGYLVFIHPRIDTNYKLWISPVPFRFGEPNVGGFEWSKTRKFYIYDCVKGARF